VVAVDCFMTESSMKADVILPAATYAERPGTFTNMEGRVLRLGQKVTAPGVAWPDWMIASELAFRMGGDLGFDHLEGIWDEIERLSPLHAGVTSDLLASRRAKDGVVVPLGLEDLPEPATLDPMAEPGIIAAETNWVSTMDVPAAAGTTIGEVRQGPVGDVGAADPLAAAGSPATDPVAAAVRAPDPAGGSIPVVDPAAGTGALAPDQAAARSTTDGDDFAAGTGPDDDAVPLDRPPVAERPTAMQFRAPTTPVPVPPIDSYSLRLVASHRLWDAGVGVQHSSHLAGLAAVAVVRANPYDLHRLGHVSGTRVRVVSPRGSLLLEVAADTGVPRGSVAIGFNLPGESAGDLIDASTAVTNVRLDSV
jgi:anaerobic selenocysteine-containing dehydrogenase